MFSDFTIVSVREAPQGFGEGVFALVTFEYVPAEMHPPLEVTRWVKGKDGKEGREYVVAAFKASRVKVTDAQLRHGERGAWLSTNPVRVPDDVREAVTLAAKQEFFKNAPSSAKAGNGGGR